MSPTATRLTYFALAVLLIAALYSLATTGVPTPGV